MSDINDKITNIFACVLQLGNSDADMVFQFISMDAEKLFEGKWLIMHRIISEYFKLTGAMIKRDEYEEFIRDASFRREEQDDYMNLFDELIQRPVNGEAFNFYVEQFKEKFLDDRSHVMLRHAYTTLSNRLHLNKRSNNGYQGMRKYLTETMYDLDHLFAEYSPEGAVADEVQAVLEEYENLKKADQSVFTGFSSLDECTGGLSPGEFWLLVGYTAEGKTSMCINIGHNAAYVHGKNVLYLTSETVKSVV
ncbi:MAG: DnaB-like helicase C-terminal domain-containing protein, partial [Desulfobacterales bacterium]